MVDSRKEFKPAEGAKVVLQYFSNERVAMLLEVNNHPVLVDLLHNLEADHDWADVIAEISAYCNVGMDGMYSNEDLELLYPQLTKRMIDTRLGESSGIILNPN